MIIRICGGWSSFNVSKNNYKLVFCIGQSEKDLVLMQEIKNFFYSIAPSSNLGEGVGFSSTKRYPHMPYAVINLLVQNQNFIANVLIPFFDSLIFNSKKGLDFQDWKTVYKLKQLGLNYTGEGIKVIDQILSQMNNRRLPTNSSAKVDRTLLTNNVEKLLNGPSNLEIKENGQIWIKSLNRYKRGSNAKSIKVQLQESNVLVLNTFDSIRSCARFLGVHPPRAKALLDNKKSILFDNKYYFIKKVEDDSSE